MNRPRYDVPPELTNLLLEFTVNVMIERPSDLVEYAARYFAGLRDERQRSGSSGRPPAIAENDEAIYSDEDEPMPPPPHRKPKGASKSTEIKPAGSRSIPLARSADSSAPQIL